MAERKVALITGGAMGQGKAHALKFAQNGFDVVLADMQDPESDTFRATVQEIEAHRCQGTGNQVRHHQG